MTSTSRRPGVWRLAAVLAALALVLAACGDDSDDDATDDTTTTEAADDTTSTEAEETTTTEAEDGGDGPMITVTPDSGLSDGQEVTIEGSGYSPDIGLGINQCADADDPDHGIESVGSGECDLGAIKAINAGPDGTFTETFTVSGGPFGESQIVCDAEHDCVLSVGELSADPDVERATETITFG